MPGWLIFVLGVIALPVSAVLLLVGYCIFWHVRDSIRWARCPQHEWRPTTRITGWFPYMSNTPDGFQCLHCGKHEPDRTSP